MLSIKLRRVFAALFFHINFTRAVGIFVGYLLISYMLLLIAGETDILKPENFFYWIIVTSSTVGYGDFSPTSSLGKLFSTLFVIPVGLSLFAFLVAKAGFYLSELTLRSKRGLRMLANQNHTLIIGWNGQRTLRLIDLLLDADEKNNNNVVLCVAKEMENPLAGKIDFVKVESFSHEPSMSRTNIKEASQIIIDTPLDDVTLTTALFCEKHNPKAHTTAYFHDESIGQLLRTHCPNIECIPSVSVEMLAKSTLDPGSSMLHKQLLDSTDGMTQYSMIYPGNSISFDALFNNFKKGYDSTIIGVRKKNNNRIDLNPSLDYQVEPDDTLFYIASSRLTSSNLKNT